MAGIRDIMGLNKANFSTVEKDFSDITGRIMANETILKLLYFNSSDCLSNKDLVITSEIIEEVVKENLRIVPSLKVPENKGSYIIVTFDSFTENPQNPEFMNNIILMDVLCPEDTWMMDSYMMRPFKIMHELQRMFHDKPLNGIGKALFIGANLLNLGDYVGYQMAFSVINDV